MVDKVRPQKLESSSIGGTENDVLPTSTNPSEDYLACKGVALEDSDNLLIGGDSGDMVFTTGGVERGRISSTGTGTGVFAGGTPSIARTFLLMGS